MTQDQVEILCNTFKLGQPIAPINRVHGGLLHKMWRLHTTKGTFAIKQLSKNIHLNEKTRKSYELTEHLASQFSKHGIPAISSMTHNGMSLIDAGDSTFIVYPWVNAKALGRDEVNVEFATKIAVIIAKIHSINLVIPEITLPEYDLHSNEKIAILIEKSLKAKLPFADNLDNAKALLFELNEKYHKAIPAFDEKLVISHGDLDQKNVLWDEECNPLLIDWESSRLVNPTYEILNVALDWSGITTESMNDDVFAVMIKTYKNTGGAINTNYLREIFYGIQGNWINWLIYNIERSLKNNSIEERDLGTEQASQTLKTIIYLNNKIDDLINIINTYDC